MHTTLDDQRLADTAVDKFQNETGLQLRLDYNTVQHKQHEIDGVLYIPDADKELLVEIKKWAANIPVGALVDRMWRIAPAGEGILIADYINPNQAEKLREANIPFLDTAGNAYLNQRPIYVYITGRKPTADAAHRKAEGRAFQPTGMKVIYAFLTKPELVNATYRDIAEQAGVALGTVGWVIHDLVEQRLINEDKKRNQRKLTDYEKLLDKWVEAYPQKLRKKLLLGNFTTEDDHWWNTVNPQDYGAVWGGEIAGAKYTHYLTPRDATLYIPKDKANLFLKDARLRKPREFERPHINIDLLEPFWKHDNNPDGLAHPVLVYADLLASGDPRNIETAQKLRDQYIR